MSRSNPRRAVIGLAALTAALLPLTATPAFAATEVVAAPLPAPSGLSPADDPATFPQTVRKDIVFSWNPVAGATGYRVQFGRDDTWSDDPLATFDVKSTALAVPQGNAYQTYTWRVAALKGSVVGHWTSETTNSQNDAQFTKGWRQGPGSLAYSLSALGVPTFTWTAVAEASRYRVAVSPEPLTGGEFEAAPTGGFLCETVRTRLTPVLDGGDYAEGAADGAAACQMALLPDTTYFWGVKGVDEAVAGGEERTLGTKGGFFTTPAAAGASTAPSESPAITSLATDPDRLCTVTNAAPERATCSDVPTLRWDPVDGVSHYNVVLSPDSAFQSVVDVVKTAATEWTSQRSWSEMSPSMAMYYSVQACGDADPAPDVTKTVCTGIDFDTPPSFRKASPRLSGLSTPVPSGRLAFTWNSHAQALAAAESPTPGAVSTASQDAKGYHVQVATSAHPSFDATVIDDTVDGPVTAAGRFTPAGGTTFIPTDQLLLNGSYLWRVQAVDSAGNKLPWSLTRSFVRDNTAPRITSVTPSYKVSTTGALKLVFSEPVTGLSSSSVWVTPAASTSLTVTGPTTATLTPTSPLLPGATYALRVASSVKDAVGNSALPGGPSFSVNPVADDGNAAIAYSAGWRVLSATNAVGGKFHSATPSSSVHQFATMTFRGTGITLTSCLGPNNGYVDTYVDGIRRGHTSLYRSYSGCGVKVFARTGMASGQHVVRIVAVNARSSASGGSTIALDALTVTP